MGQTSSSNRTMDVDDEEEDPATSSEEEQEQEEENTDQSRRRYNLRRRAANRNASHTLQTILAVLAGRSGEDYLDLMHPSSDSDSSDTEGAFRFPVRKERPRRCHKPTEEQLKVLEQSDFCLLTKRTLGQDLKRNSTTKPNCDHRVNLLSLIARREMGNFRHSRGLSAGAKCQVYQTFLPNKCRKMAEYHQKVFCGTFSHCGNLFLSACQDQKIRLYDSCGGQFKLKNTIRARNVGWSVLDTALSPDNRHLIYSSWCDYIHQVNLVDEDQKHEALPLGPEDVQSRFCLFSLRFSASGDEILGGANDGYLYLYDRAANTQSLKIDAHEDDVNAVAFVDTPTHILASGGDDGLCKIWDRRALRESHPVPVGVFAGHVDGIAYIDPRGDGRHLITNSKDQSIKLWDLRRFSGSKSVEETRKAVKNQKWDYRWQNAPRGLNRSQSVSEDSSVMTYRGHMVLQTLIRSRFSPIHTTGQKFIYTGCASGAVIIYDTLTGEIVKELQGHKSCVRDVSWHPYQPEILSSSWDFTVAKWTYSEDQEEEENTSEDVQMCNGK